MNSFDFKMRKPEQVRQSVMAKLKKYGKGIVLMHDFQQATAERHRRPAQRPQGRRLQDRAHEPSKPVTTIASYDEEILKDAKLPTVSCADLERGAHGQRIDVSIIP